MNSLIKTNITDNVAETANRHLNDLDLLFAVKSHLSWEAEEFELLKFQGIEHVEYVGSDIRPEIE